MIKRVLFCFMALLLLPINVSANDTSPWEINLSFEDATIHYVISGLENGTEVLYIRDHGRETATYHTTKTTMMGINMVNETVEIENPDWVYEFNLTEKTGTKRVNPEKYMIEEYNKLSSDDQKQVRGNGEKLGTSVTEGFGGTIKQDAKTILGYSCNKAEVMGTVVYSIQDSTIPLLVESNMMGMTMKMEATAVDIGKVNNSYFAFPKGIEPRLDPQSDAMAREIAKATIAALKDPESISKQAGMPMFQEQQQLTPEEQEEMKQAMEMLKGMFGTQPQ